MGGVQVPGGISGHDEDVHGLAVFEAQVLGPVRDEGPGAAGDLVALELLGDLQGQLERGDAVLAAGPRLAVVPDAVQEMGVLALQGLDGGELGLEYLDVLEALDDGRLLAVDLESRVAVVQ